MTSLIHIPMLADANFSMELFLLLAMVLPAWVMASIDAPALVPCLSAVGALGPEIRRLNDWGGGYYQSVTILSLIPSAATGSLLIPVLRHLSRIPAETRKSAVMVLMPLCYGTMMGVLLNGLGGLVEGLGFVLPFLFAFYAASQPYVESHRSRWLRTYFLVSVVVALYGWYQYFTAPPWDMLWMMGSRMYTSVGKPEPMAFRPFSTLGAPLALGMFLAMALVIGICSRKWRGLGGILGMFIMSTCLLISLDRTVWIVLAAAVATLTLFSKGKYRWMSIGAITILSTAVYLLLPLLPGADAVNARMASFANLNNDASTQARVGILGTLVYAATDPLGHGFGSNGVSAKLADTNAAVNMGSDSGFLDVCTTLGMPMTLMVTIGVIRLARQAIKPSAVSESDAKGRTPFNVLAAAMTVAWLVSMLSYDTLGGAGGVLLWLSIGCPIGCKTASRIESGRSSYMPREFARSARLSEYS